MSNNDVKIDHEAAKRYAAYIGDMARDHACGQDDVNLSAAYLDAMAQRDEATELLRTLKARLDRYESITGDDYAAIRAFLAKHRKTGA